MITLYFQIDNFTIADALKYTLKADEVIKHVRCFIVVKQPVRDVISMFEEIKY